MIKKTHKCWMDPINIISDINKRNDNDIKIDKDVEELLSYVKLCSLILQSMCYSYISDYTSGDYIPSSSFYEIRRVDDLKKEMQIAYHHIKSLQDERRKELLSLFRKRLWNEIRYIPKEDYYFKMVKEIFKIT